MDITLATGALVFIAIHHPHTMLTDHPGVQFLLDNGYAKKADIDGSGDRYVPTQRGVDWLRVNTGVNEDHLTAY